MNIDLNCDLGEGFPADATLMPLISSANIACAGHAGDITTIVRALRLAAQHHVQAGAHPGFLDREHFGRRELILAEQDIFDDCDAQVSLLASLAESQGVPIRYLKPHGALYNLAHRDPAYARPLVEVACKYRLALMALPGSQLQHLSQGRCPFIAEGFADRRYQSDGSLVPRTHANAMITAPEEAVAQMHDLIRNQGIQTLCVHGDNPEAVNFVRALRSAMAEAQITISPFTIA